MLLDGLVDQTNRIKLLISVAKDNIRKEESIKNNTLSKSKEVFEKRRLKEKALSV